MDFWNDSDDEEGDHDKENLPEKASFVDVPKKAGRHLLDSKGYKYARSKPDVNKNGYEYYKCANKTIYCCQATCKVSIKDPENPLIVQKFQDHCHDNDILKGKVDVIVDKHVKATSGLPGITPQQVLGEISSEVMKKCGPLGVGSLMSVQALRKRIQRERVRVIGAPKKPKTMADLANLPIQFTEMENGDKFLIMNKEIEGGQRILGFSSEEMLELMRVTDIMLVDGTFKVVEGTLFSQMFTVYGRSPINKKVVPCAYYLLPGKQTIHYEMVFHHMKRALRLPGPKAILVDYEIAIHTAIKAVFPEVKISGCDTHFKAIIDRSIKRLGLAKLRNESFSFQSVVRMVWCLTLVQEDYLPESWMSVMNTVGQCTQDFGADGPAIQKWLDFLRDQFMGEWWEEEDKSWRMIKTPRYDFSIWSKHSTVLAGEMRSTNSAEGYHNGIQSLVPRNASEWTLIAQLQKKLLSTSVALKDATKESSNTAKENFRKAKYKQLQNVVRNFSKAKDFVEFVKLVQDYQNHTLLL